MCLAWGGRSDQVGRCRNRILRLTNEELPQPVRRTVSIKPRFSFPAVWDEIGTWPSQRQEAGRIGLWGYVLPCVCRRLARWKFPAAVEDRVPSHMAFLPHPASVHTADVTVWVWMVWVSGRRLIYLGAGVVFLLSHSCFFLGKHIYWRHLTPPGALSEHQCRCTRFGARTAKN